MFKNIPIGVRLMSGFLIVACLVALVSIMAYMELNKVLTPLTRDIPKGLQEIEITSHLDGVAQKIRYLDQILTDAARNYAFTEDRKWKYRYQIMQPQLESNIKEAIKRGGDWDKEIFSDLHKAEMGFVEMENEAIKSVDSGVAREAVRILESPDYWQFKEEYKKGLEAYVQMRGKKYGQTLEVTSTKVNQIVDQTHELVQESLKFLTMIGIFAIILAAILGLIVSNSILMPIQALQRGAQIIGKGDLHYRIGIDARDEIGQLAVAFNEMTAKLKESYSGLEGKVRDKTRELAQKVEEIQKILSDLEIAKGKIEQEKVRYEALLASIGDGMIATDQSGQIMIMNHQAELMLGWNAEEAYGRTVTDMTPCLDEKGGVLASDKNPTSLALATGRKVSTTAYYTRKDRSHFPVSITVSPIVLENAIIGAIEIFRDITKEKDVDRMKTEFISTVSHELRTPLTVIREGVSLVLDEMLGSVTKEQRTFLSLSLEDIDRLRRIIDNLLDISRIEAGRLEIKLDRIDMVDVVKGIQALFAQRVKDRGLTLKTRFSAPSIEMYADRDKIIQVFTNLVGNALKFTDKGFLEISAEDQGDYVRCAVTDTGIGMAPEALPRVFGKFEQFHREAGIGEKGTGLGLSIAKGIVELHKGRIGVDSKLHEGTTFAFILPKFKARDLLKDYVIKNLKEAARQGASFSILAIHMNPEENVVRRLGPEKIRDLLTNLEKLIKKGLRGQADTLIRDVSSVFLILPNSAKTEAFHLAEKLEHSFHDYLGKEKIKKEEAPISCQVATYPEDGSTEDPLLEKIFI